MAPKRVFRRHLPLITNRIGFTVQVLPPPPPITLRINLAERIKHRRSRRDGVSPVPKLVVMRPANTNRETTPSAPCDAEVPQGLDFSDLSDQDIDELEDDSPQPGTSTATLIPKPPGEPGRPHSGGFNLEDAVVSSGWSKQEFSAFRKQTHELISQVLDESKAFSKQPQIKLSRIYRKLEKQFPRLCQYEEHWPATCIIKAKLKGTSEVARRQATKATSPASRETTGAGD